MADQADRKWSPMPSFFAARIIRALFFLVPITGGMILFLWHTEARDLSKFALWQFPVVVLAFLMALPVATRVLEALRRRGAFGTVRLDGASLEMGGREDAIDLVRPFEADLRKIAARIERFIQGAFRSGRSGRTHVQIVHVLAAVLRQDGKSFTLYCDHCERATGLKGEPYGLEGLPVRPLPLLPPAGKIIRMRPDDLVDVLRAVSCQEVYVDATELASDGEPCCMLVPPAVRQRHAAVHEIR